jgi:hypothetical protein
VFLTASRRFRPRTDAVSRNIGFVKVVNWLDFGSAGNARRDADLHPPDCACRHEQAMHTGKPSCFLW